MAVDVKESATKKLGPLHVWGWAVVVAGAVLLAKRLQPSEGTKVAAGNPEIVGGGEGLPAEDGGADDTALLSRISSLEGLTTQYQTQIAGLSSDIGNVTLLNTLQTKLATYLQQYSKALADVEHWRTVYRTAPTAAKKREAEKNRDAAQARAATLLKNITATQAEIKKVGT